MVRTSGSFVLRTPALPFDELRRWTDGIDAAARARDGAEAASRAQWDADIDTLRGRLRDIVSRPEVVQALFVASPSLASSLDHWKHNPDDRKGLKTERALVRYFGRMCGRPMPFGIFSACSIGRVDEAGATTDIVLAGRDRYRTRTRLDFDYLFALTAVLRRDPVLCRELRYAPNPTLRRLGDVWHVIESRVSGSDRSHHLVKLYADEFLDAAIETARNGARIDELVQGIRRTPGGGECSDEEAAEYIRELIDSEVLVSSLTPLVTGSSPLDEIITRLESLDGGASVAKILSAVRSGLEIVDRHGLGAAPDEYIRLADSLKPLPATFDIARLYQVDMIKPVGAAILAKPVIDDLTTGLSVLCRIGQLGEATELRAFREAFSARYEEAWVPLTEALDEDSGVPFGPDAGADSSPLLRGLQLGNGGSAGGERFGPFHTMLLKKVIECERDGRDELVLEDGDIPPSGSAFDYLPDAFDVSAVLASSSMEAVNAGEFTIYVRGGGGPSGARLIGRFCHADPAFEEATRKHLRDEEALYPDAVFAEIVYLPEGRLGNVLCRPVLRDYEIICMGRSGAAPERQLPLSDLWISVRRGAILLYSQRLGRRVIPRLTNAHGYMNPTLAKTYRFLAYLQGQGAGGGVPSFYWGPLDAFDRLPRVRYGRQILAIARWKISPEDVRQLDKSDKVEAFAAVQQLRARRRMPRWVSLVEGDNTLPVDLENPLCVDAMVHAVRRAHQSVLTEMFPGPDELCIAGPEGSFAHELLVPFVRKQSRVHEQSAATAIQQAIAAMKVPVPLEVRSSPPGSEWLYLKIYGGESALDDVLVSAIDRLLARIRQAPAFSKWFFIRYADPHQHLRIRFQGEPRWLSAELLPLIHQTLRPALDRGRIWRIQVDTYQREVERYGGPEAMLLAEDIFCADSEAVLDILKILEGDDGLDARWRLALLGVHKLFEDCGIPEDARPDAITRARESLAEFRIGAGQRKQFGERFRAQRKALEALFDPRAEHDALIGPTRAALEWRSVRIEKTVRQLEALDQRGALRVPIPDLVGTYSHMHVNRIVRASPRAHELVLYELLSRVYQSRLARTAQTRTETAAAAT